jgi:hypothetical protein
MFEPNRPTELFRKPCALFGTLLLIACGAEVAVALLRPQLEITASMVMRDAASEVAAC